MAKKLKIGYVLDDTLDVADGVQQAMISIGEAMRARGHDVHYIVPDTTRTDLPNIHSVGKLWALKFNGNSVRTPLPVRKNPIITLLDSIQLDIVHVQAPYSPLFAGKILQASGRRVKIFSTFHILPYNKLSAWGTRILGIVSQRTHRLITTSYAVSEPALEFMKTTYGLPGTVLPNPVNYEFYHKTHIDTRHKLRVVFVGRFEDRKGVKQLIEAWNLLPKELQRDAELIMCGKGPLHESMEALAEQLQLDIQFPGFVSEEQKATYLASADIAVFPSTSGESFGIVLAEAMAAGARVTIGGNNPGYRSVLQQWPSVLFDATDPRAIAQCIETFLENSTERERIGNEQHEVVKRYDIQAVATQLERDYYQQDL